MPTIDLSVSGCYHFDWPKYDYTGADPMSSSSRMNTLLNGRESAISSNIGKTYQYTGWRGYYQTISDANSTTQTFCKNLEALGYVPGLGWSLSHNPLSVGSTDTARVTAWTTLGNWLNGIPGSHLFLPFGEFDRISGIPAATDWIRGWRLMYNTIHPLSPRTIFGYCVTASHISVAENYYPGDSYVDIFCPQGYNGGGGTHPAKIFDPLWTKWNPTDGTVGKVYFGITEWATRERASGNALACLNAATAIAKPTWYAEFRDWINAHPGCVVEALFDVDKCHNQGGGGILIDGRANTTPTGGTADAGASMKAYSDMIAQTNAGTTPSLGTPTITAKDSSNVTVANGGTTTATGMTFTFSATNATSYKISLDGGTLTTDTSPKVYASGTFTTGSHTFKVQATDGTSTKSTTFSWGVGVTPPTSNPPDLRTNIPQGSSATATLTLARPTDSITADVLIAQIVFRGQANIAAPAGWTLVNQRQEGTVLTQAIFYKVQQLTESGTYDFTNSAGSTAGMQGAILGITGADASTIATSFVAADSAGTAGTAISPPAITTSVGNSMVISFASANQATSFTPHTNWNEPYDFQQNIAGITTHSTIQSQYQTYGNANVAVTATDTLVASSRWITHVLNLDPGTNEVAGNSSFAFGINHSNLNLETAAFRDHFLSTVQDLAGAGSVVRTDMYGTQQVPGVTGTTEGSIAWPQATYDTLANEMGDRGLTWVPLIRLRPSSSTIAWATPYLKAGGAANATQAATTGTMTPWSTFVTALVNRYGPGGSFFTAFPSTNFEPINTWHIWAEPDGYGSASTFPNGRGYMTPTSTGGDANLYQVVDEAITAIRSVDTDAIIMGPGMSQLDPNQFAKVIDYWKANSKTAWWATGRLNVVTSHLPMGKIEIDKAKQATPSYTTPKNEGSTTYQSTTPYFVAGSGLFKSINSVGWLRQLINGQGGSDTVQIGLTETGFAGDDTANSYNNASIVTTSPVEYITTNSAKTDSRLGSQSEWEAQILEYIPQQNALTSGAWNCTYFIHGRLFDTRSTFSTDVVAYYKDKMGLVYYNPTTDTDPAYFTGDLGTGSVIQGTATETTLATGSNTTTTTVTPAALRATASADVSVSTGASSVSLTIPATVQTGDIMFAVVNWNTLTAMTTPTGWTLVESKSPASGTTSALYYKKATNTDASSTLTMSNASSGVRFALAFAAYSSTDATTFLDVAIPAAASGTSTGGSSLPDMGAYQVGAGTPSTVPTPTITPATDKDVLLSFFTARSNTAGNTEVYTAPSGEVIDVQRTGNYASGLNPSVAVSRETLVGQTATGGKFAAITSAAYSVAWSVLLRPLTTTTTTPGPTATQGWKPGGWAAYNRMNVSANLPPDIINVDPVDGSVILTASASQTTAVVTISADVDDPDQNTIKSVTVSIDNGTPVAMTASGSTYSTTATLSGSTAGTSHTITIRATDNGTPSLVGKAISAFTVQVPAGNNPPPAPTITSPGDLATNPTPTFTFSDTQVGVTFIGTLDAISLGTITSPYTTSTLADGVHTFSLVAHDPTTGLDSSTSSTVWSLSTVGTRTPPNPPVILTGPSTVTENTSATFTFTPQPNTTVTAYFDGGPIGTVTSPFTISSVDVGNHTLQLYSVDTADVTNISTPASYNWTVQGTVSVPSRVTKVLTPTAPQVIENWRVVYYDHEGHPFGESAPTQLNFAKYLKKVGDHSFTLHLSDNMAKDSRVYPYLTDYIIFRGNRDVAGGLITGVQVDASTETITFAGLDWMHYLEKVMLDFDPSAPTAGNYHKTSATDIFDVVRQLFNLTMGVNRGILNVPAGNAGFGQKVSVLASDFENLFDIVSRLSDQLPGFDFEADPDSTFRMYAGKKQVDTDYVIDLARNATLLTYENRGVTATHIYGTGSSSSSARALVRRFNTQLSATYRKLMENVDFGDVPTKAYLSQLADAEVKRANSPAIDLVAAVRPQPNDDFWSRVGLGYNTTVRGNLGYTVLNMPLRVTSMQAEVNAQGDETVTISVTSDDDV